MKLIEFKSNQKTPFALKYNLYVFENRITDVNFGDLSKLILKKEKQILSNTNNAGDGNTGLGENSLTSRYKHFNVLKWEDENISKIKKNIVNTYGLLMNTLGYEKINDLYIQCWANVMRKGEQIKIHQHGVDENSFLGGHICVQSENTSTHYLNPITYHAKKDSSKYSSEDEVGKLSLFSNILPHYTDTYDGESERITIAFDLFTYKKSDNCFKLDI